MVAPRTRADEPAHSPPAAHPARKTTRRAAPNRTDGSPPTRIRSKANGAALNGASTKSAGTDRPPTATKPATKAPRANKPARDSPAALGEAIVASIQRHDPDADVTQIRAAVAFAIEAHADARRASGEPFVTHPIAAAQILADLG